MTMGYTKTSVLLRVSGLVIFVSFLLHVIGFASPFWSIRDDGNEGLWEICSDGVCISPSHSLELKDEAWHTVVVTFEVFGLATAIVAIILFLILLVNTKIHTNSLMISTTVFTYLTAIFILVGEVIYGTRGLITLEAAFDTEFHLGFAFCLMIIATIGWLLAGILLSVALDLKIESTRNESKDAAERTVG